MSKPWLTVEPALVPVLEELQRLEPLFHAAAREATPQWFEKLVAPGFWETGASGLRYDRAFALKVLSERQREPADDNWETSEFNVIEASRDCYLLTYKLRQPGRVTLRATLWRREAAGWQAVYHQGTVVAENT